MVPDEAWVPLSEAASRLGIAYDTARKRLAAGTLRGEKRGGRWVVAVSKTETVPDAEPEHSGRDPDAFVVHLEAEVAYLRAQMAVRDEEIRRRDHIIAGLIDREPALPAETAQDAPGTQNTAPPARETAADALGALRALWRRMRGG